MRFAITRLSRIGCGMLAVALVFPHFLLAADPHTTGAARSSSPITLDGKLDEPAWREAEVFTLTQQSPRPGQPTPFKTEVRVLVSNDAIYFGFTCRDPNPNAISIHTMR